MIITFIEKWGLPVVSTYMGKGVVPENHFLHLGALGAFSGDVAFRAVLSADVVLAVGYDFAELPVGYWNRDRRHMIIHMDSTPANTLSKLPITLKKIRRSYNRASNTSQNGTGTR